MFLNLSYEGDITLNAYEYNKTYTYTYKWCDRLGSKPELYNHYNLIRITVWFYTGMFSVSILSMSRR